MLKVIGVPEHPFKVGVTTIVPVVIVKIVSGVRKGVIFPVPDDGRPIPKFEFVQVYVAPGVPEKVNVEVNNPLQKEVFGIVLTVGVGFTVITLLTVELAPFSVAVHE